MKATMTPVSSREFSPTERRRRKDCRRCEEIKTRSGDGMDSIITGGRGFGLVSGKSEIGGFECAVHTALAAQFIAGADRDDASAMHDADAVGHFFGDAELVRGNENGHSAEGALFEDVFQGARVMRIE